MKFDDIIDLQPKITLGELIQLFLLGYDDKIYIDLVIGGNEFRSESIDNVRILDSRLEPYYTNDILWMHEGADCLLVIGISEK